MIVYRCEPIDFWFGWQRPGAVFRPDASGGGAYFHHLVEEWPPLWERAKRLARSLGWEGDVREGPFVTVLPPADGACSPSPVAIAWKQGNNGATFIATPYRLPWLDDGHVDMAEEG